MEIVKNKFINIRCVPYGGLSIPYPLYPAPSLYFKVRSWHRDDFQLPDWVNVDFFPPMCTDIIHWSKSITDVSIIDTFLYCHLYLLPACVSDIEDSSAKKKNMKRTKIDSGDF